MNAEIDHDSIIIQGREVTPPYGVDDAIKTQNRVLLVLGSDQINTKEDPDFDLPSADRNLVALGASGDIEWAIASTNIHSAEGYYRKLWRIDDTFLARHTYGIVEFDASTGAVNAVYQENTIPLGTREISVSGKILDVIEYQGAVFVGCSGSHALYAFEKDGTERWRSEEGQRRGRIDIDDGKLREHIPVANQAYDIHRIDPDTGDRIETTEIRPDWMEDS